MNGFFEHQYLRYKKKHLQNLAAMAFVDGNLHQQEKNLLYTVGEKYGLKGWQIAKIIENQRPFQFDVPEDVDQRLDQIYDLVKMMLADEIIEDRELALCKLVAANFGFKKELVNTILHLIQKGKSGKFEWNLFKQNILGNNTLLSGQA